MVKQMDIFQDVSGFIEHESDNRTTRSLMLASPLVQRIKKTTWVPNIWSKKCQADDLAKSKLKVLHALRPCCVMWQLRITEDHMGPLFDYLKDHFKNHIPAQPLQEVPPGPVAQQ